MGDQASKTGLGASSGLPRGSRNSNKRVSGPKYYNLNGIWDLKPYNLGSWTLRVMHGGQGCHRNNTVCLGLTADEQRGTGTTWFRVLGFGFGVLGLGFWVSCRVNTTIKYLRRPRHLTVPTPKPKL